MKERRYFRGSCSVSCYIYIVIVVVLSFVNDYVMLGSGPEWSGSFHGDDPCQMEII